MIHLQSDSLMQTGIEKPKECMLYDEQRGFFQKGGNTSLKPDREPVAYLEFSRTTD